MMWIVAVIRCAASLNTSTHPKSVKLRIFGILAIAVAIVELIFCFPGPIRFVQRTTFILFPPFVSNLTPDQVTEVSAFIEKQIALTKSYSITNHSFVEEYFIRTDPDTQTNELRTIIEKNDIILNMKLYYVKVA